MTFGMRAALNLIGLRVRVPLLWAVQLIADSRRNRCHTHTALSHASIGKTEFNASFRRVDEVQSWDGGVVVNVVQTWDRTLISVIVLGTRHSKLAIFTDIPFYSGCRWHTLNDVTLLSSLSFKGKKPAAPVRWL